MSKPETHDALPAVELRPLSVGDATTLLGGLSDPRLYRFLEERPPASLAALQERYRFLLAGAPAQLSETWLNWVIEDATNGRALGTAQATVHEEKRYASIAYVLFRDQWGHGYAQSAVSRLLQMLADQTDADRAQAEIHEDNERSIRVVQQLGFVHTDTVQEDGYLDVVYSLPLSRSESSQPL